MLYWLSIYIRRHSLSFSHIHTHTLSLSWSLSHAHACTNTFAWTLQKKLYSLAEKEKRELREKELCWEGKKVFSLWPDFLLYIVSDEAEKNQDGNMYTKEENYNTFLPSVKKYSMKSFSFEFLFLLHFSDDWKKQPLFMSLNYPIFQTIEQ